MRRRDRVNSLKQIVSICWKQFSTGIELLAVRFKTSSGGVPRSARPYSCTSLSAYSTASAGLRPIILSSGSSLSVLRRTCSKVWKLPGIYAINSKSGKLLVNIRW
jgi:hypothetical protein